MCGAETFCWRCLLGLRERYDDSSRRAALDGAWSVGGEQTARGAGEPWGSGRRPSGNSQDARVSTVQLVPRVQQARRTGSLSRAVGGGRQRGMRLHTRTSAGRGCVGSVGAVGNVGSQVPVPGSGGCCAGGPQNTRTFQVTVRGTDLICGYSKWARELFCVGWGLLLAFESANFWDAARIGVIGIQSQSDAKHSSS